MACIVCLAGLNQIRPSGHECGDCLNKETNKIATHTAATGCGEVNKAWFMAVLSLTVFAAISAILIVPPLLVEIATDLEISVAVAGQLATATFAGWAVSLVSCGPLSDSFGRRPVALIGLAVLSISILASAFAPILEFLLTLRVLTGLGGGAIPPNIVGAVSDVISPARRAQAVGALLAIQGLASAITVPFVAVLADVGGWRLVFIVYGLVLVVGLLANWLWLPKDQRERVRIWGFFSRYRSLVSMRFFPVAVAVNLTQRFLGDAQLFRRLPDTHVRLEHRFCCAATGANRRGADGRKLFRFVPGKQKASWGVRRRHHSSRGSLLFPAFHR